MAKKLTPLQRRLQGKQARQDRVKLEVEVDTKPSKPVPPGKATSATKYSKSVAKKIDDFVKEVSEIRAAQIRDEMNRDPHVLVVNAAQFSSLIRDHQVEIQRVAAKAKDPVLKAELLNAGRVNTYKLASKLQRRFEEILEAELNKKRILKWRVKRQGNVSLYFIEAEKDNVPIFKRFQEVITQIRKDLVQKSQSGTTERALSVLIAGFDVDYDDITGGVGGDQAKKKLLANAPIGRDGQPVAGAGIQLGHFRGGATVSASKKLELIKKYQSGIVGLTGLYFEARGFHDTIHEHDAEVRFNDVVYNIANKELGGAVDISIIGLEGSARNQLSGSFTRQQLKNFDDWLKKNAASIVTTKGSKPVVNMILDDLVDDFLGFNIPSRKIARRAKTRKRFKGKTPGVGTVFQTKIDGSKLALLAADNESLSPDRLMEIIDLINRKLHDQIRENMGKGNSRTILNYRTGRFARSAEVQALYDTTEKNAIAARVKYLKDPYQVFEPGQSNLALPGRNPARIFGRSIRQILQEEKIANLRRVKVDLSG